MKEYKSQRSFTNPIYYIVSFIFFLLFIGILTAVSPMSRISSNIISEWTKKVDGSTFLYLIGMEAKVFQPAYPSDMEPPNVAATLFELATNIIPDDPRSLFGNELPGTSTYYNQILIAGEGTDYSNLPIESSPPFEEVIKDREAVVENEPPDVEISENNQHPTSDQKTVFIYNTHNTESFLPHLPGVSDINSAYHKEVNITKVSERLAKSLEANGIGTQVDDTNIMGILNKRGWSYGKAYQASREVVEEVIATNKDFRYSFDLHRDSQRRDITTIRINGEDYAKIFIVIGTDNASYKRNEALSYKLHYMIEEKYPGLSRGVLPKGGKHTNGVFNQDLTENALLFEIGGVDNNLEELYRTADALAEIFSEFYWEAEKVSN